MVEDFEPESDYFGESGSVKEESEYKSEFEEDRDTPCKALSRISEVISKDKSKKERPSLMNVELDATSNTVDD